MLAVFKYGTAEHSSNIAPCLPGTTVASLHYAKRLFKKQSRTRQLAEMMAMLTLSISKETLIGLSVEQNLI